MSFFKDMISVFKKRELSFLESSKESEGVHSFLFEKPKDVTWTAGQHGLFTITHKKVKNSTKPFTLSSTPAENVVKITTLINDEPSEFKQALLELKHGMNIKMSGPVGSFHLKDNRPALLIAGGIGITPYRSVLKQLEAEGRYNEKQLNLLYMSNKMPDIFKEELGEMAENNVMNVKYVDSRDHLYEEIDKFITLYQNNGNYFIAGPKSMVDSISVDLRSKNISKRNITKDGFFGY
ncbi:FAD-dependent oxidoreductase [Salibacterium aidingense]|uniref:FAD-dependent oxidoreductase n=1 Tax=Salibacterium aidingense TaxID=384933 RepID=UPI0004075263|nr:FAD-dependent oxidoreductase [Salibacterium aidingense]